MTFLQMLIIAVVQGITEFLPISSSGHLILVPVFTGAADQGPMIDIAVHVGSLLAIIVYFFKDVLGLARGDAPGRVRRPMASDTPGRAARGLLDGCREP